MLLAGPEGSGKTTLLHALASELAPLRSAVYLAHPRLPLGGFWMRLAGELDLEPGYDAKRRVLRRAADLAREGGSLLLLVDDASELPAETLYALIATARSEPGIQLVLARSDAASLAGPLPDDVPVVRINGVAPAVAAAPSPEPPVSALPALTARRRSRERRKRAAWAVGGLLVGLALGTLASAPVWRALQGALAPVAPGSPREARSAPPPPAEEAPPLAASERALPPPAATAPPAPSPRADAPPAAAPPSIAAAPSTPAPEPAPPRTEEPAAAAPLAAAPPPATPAPEVAAPAPAAPAPAPAAPAPSPSAAAPAPAVAAPPPAAPRPRAGPPALGLLSVTSDSDVRIEVDGRPYGPAPVYGVQLSKGEHRVLAHYPDGAVALKTIYLDAENVSVFFR